MAVDVKGWSQLLDTVLLEHFYLMQRVQTMERAGLKVDHLHWIGWWLLLVGEAVEAHINSVESNDDTYLLSNYMFYKLASIVEDCKNNGRKGS